jgi:hypothetical protein
MSNEFPVYNNEGLSEYMEKITKFRQSVNSKKYKIIFKFIKKWVDKKDIMKGLTDFKDVKLKNLPNEEKCLKILNKSKKICKKLNIEYKFDKEFVEKKYKELAGEDKRIKKNIIDTEYPFRSELLTLIKKILNTIGYKLLVVKTKDNIFISIVSKHQIN